MVKCARCPKVLDEMVDEELVELALDGDERAFECLIDRHTTTFLRLSLGILRNQPDAEDAVQNACLSIYRKLDSFNGDGSFAGWAYRIATNSALMLLRKQKRRRETDIDNIPSGDLELRSGARLDSDPHRRLARKEVREAFARALCDMEPKYRVAIELRELDGRSMEEMSDQLDLSVGGVKTRLHRARANLRAWLEGEYDVSLDHFT